jgi:hypothetical protein
MQNSKLGTHGPVRIQMEFCMNGVDFLCGVPLWTSVFSVVKILKPLPQRSQCFTEKNTDSGCHGMIQLFRQPKNQIKYYPIRRAASPSL